MQTSSKPVSLDISSTDDVTHVYVKVEEPQGLSPRFEGPYEVISRPSRSQVQVRVGSFANGSPRLLTFHWSACKPAHMRPEAVEGQRPKLGRRPAEVPNPTETLRPVASTPATTLTESKQNSLPVATAEPAKIQIDENLRRSTRVSRNPNPVYT